MRWHTSSASSSSAEIVADILASLHVEILLDRRRAQGSLRQLPAFLRVAVTVADLIAEVLKHDRWAFSSQSKVGAPHGRKSPHRGLADAFTHTHVNEMMTALKRLMSLAASEEAVCIYPDAAKAERAAFVAGAVWALRFQCSDKTECWHDRARARLAGKEA